jgi:hypothetical protein
MHRVIYIFFTTILVLNSLNANYIGILKGEKSFPLILDKNNKIKKIYTYQNNAINKNSDEDIIFINEKGYYPFIDPDTKSVQCGVGSFLGWVSLLPANIDEINITDYSKKNPKVCEYRFTKVDSAQVAQRTIGGLFTFMTSFASGLTLHTRMFDEDSFKEAIRLSNLPSYKDLLVEKLFKLGVKGKIDVIYLKNGDIKDTLEEKYDELTNSDDPVPTLGVVFVDNNSNELFFMDIFDTYQSLSLIHSISLQLDELLIAIPVDNNSEKIYEEFEKKVPNEISPPLFPKMEKLTKSEYETDDEFKIRVDNKASQREKDIEKIYTDYLKAVQERNHFIEQLQEEYKELLKKDSNNKKNIIEELNENLPLLAKVMFLENTWGFDAKDFHYDAQTQRLYYDVFSKRDGFYQKVFSNVPSYIAKSVKEDNSFRIIPLFSAYKNNIKLNSFKLLETKSERSFETIYTNINFQPNTISMTVKAVNQTMEELDQNSLNKMQQIPIDIKDLYEKEVWYIDVVNRINGKVPQWFIQPDESDNIIGYGDGDTLEEAKANARKDLAYMIEVLVKGSFELTKDIGNIKNYKNLRSSINQTLSIKLSSDSYKVFRQEKLDGRWYIGLVLKEKY